MADQAPSCKVRGCHELALSARPVHHGLCERHFETYADGRPRCKVCKRRFATDPYVDAMCEICHPAARELDPLEAQILDALRRGESPTAMLQASDPQLTHKAAQNLVTRTRQGMRGRMRKHLDSADLSIEALLTQLKQNVHAKKHVRVGEDIVEVTDVRSSNQALDLAFKVGGYYPPRAKQTDKNAEVKIAVAMLPAEVPRSLDTPVFTLPSNTAQDDEPGE